MNPIDGVPRRRKHKALGGKKIKKLKPKGGPPGCLLALGPLFLIAALTADAIHLTVG